MRMNIIFLSYCWWYICRGTKVLWLLVRFPQNKEILSPNLSAGTKTSHLKPCTNMCVPVTHEKLVHYKRDFAFQKHRKSNFPVFEVGGISLWEFPLHNRCGSSDKKTFCFVLKVIVNFEQTFDIIKYKWQKGHLVIESFIVQLLPRN